ncbi:MAG: rhodanese-like domain-containing protein [Terracidiphilus sp.]
MTTYYWIVYFILFGGLLAFMVARRSGQVSKKDAADLLKHGAVVVDVRRAAEFNSGHLSQAFNIPVDEIEGALREKFSDKSRVILVHCKTGLRSRKAKEKMTRMGYTQVFDLGSYERAFRIVTGKTT